MVHFFMSLADFRPCSPIEFLVLVGCQRHLHDVCTSIKNAQCYVHGGSVASAALKSPDPSEGPEKQLM